MAMQAVAVATIDEFRLIGSWNTTYPDSLIDAVGYLTYEDAQKAGGLLLATDPTLMAFRIEKRTVRAT